MSTLAPAALADLTVDTLKGHVDALRDDVVAMLSRLVAYPSLRGAEGPAQTYMREVFASLGLEIDAFEIDVDEIAKHPGYSPALDDYAGRPNVVGIHRPKHGTHGRSLILNGHIDVVPVGDETLWARAPFAPAVVDGRLYGRGSGDMKAGIVAYTMAFRLLRELGYEPAAPVYLQSVIEEECTGNGALACLVRGYEADAAIIPEPTDGTIMDAQAGVAWLELDVSGLPAHAATATKGCSAIEFVWYLYQAIKRLEAKWNEPCCRHHRFADMHHPINFNLGVINGGEWASSVATRCHAEIRIGYYPGMTADIAIDAVKTAIGEAFDAHPNRHAFRWSVTNRGFKSDGFALDRDIPLIRTLRECHADVTDAPAEFVAFAGTTDAKFFNLYGTTPALCYGPAGQNIHGIDESVAIGDVLQVTTVIAWFIARWCGLNRIE
ncbi:ArgE/DapE family deacylase [Burkholderia guangdongensis]|uniref:ArgE/DapE family deacylase n=1 Tax=Burkholderia guangdongensis TaxID=1792500 RepID=UPI0015C710CF|nr:ArgE/DapE family deacylase [Burkholderia guangdongensis]